MSTEILRQKAEEIATETQKHGNTKERIAGAFVEAAEVIDNALKSLNEISEREQEILSILLTNNIDLDTLQEIVDYIKTNRETIDNLVEIVSNSSTIIFLRQKFMEEEHAVTDSMIADNQIKVIVSEIIDTSLERNVYLNGVFIPRSMSTLDSNNTFTINLAPLGIEPKVGDVVTLKYYKP